MWAVSQCWLKACAVLTAIQGPPEIKWTLTRSFSKMEHLSIEQEQLKRAVYISLPRAQRYYFSIPNKQQQKIFQNGISKHSIRTN